jgi:2-methylisocitrate lyase-like PEP mutase family enzyme
LGVLAHGFSSTWGFEALTTTSGGLAYTLGKPDGLGQVAREETMTNATAIVDATDLPVAADLENRCRDSPDALAETIRVTSPSADLRTDSFTHSASATR